MYCKFSISIFQFFDKMTYSFAKKSKKLNSYNEQEFIVKLIDQTSILMLTKNMFIITSIAFDNIFLIKILRVNIQDFFICKKTNIIILKMKNFYANFSKTDQLLGEKLLVAKSFKAIGVSFYSRRFRLEIIGTLLKIRFGYTTIKTDVAEEHNYIAMSVPSRECLVLFGLDSFLLLKLQFLITKYSHAATEY